MRIIIYLLTAGLLLNACGSTKQTATKSTSTTKNELASITNKKWKLTELYNQPVADKVNEKRPFLQFNESEYRYNASAGCNGLGGSYSLPGKGKIKFSQGMSTMMYCNEMKVEEQFNKVLAEAEYYTQKDNTLTFSNSKKVVIARFVAINEDYAAKLNGTWEVTYISGPRITFEGLYPNEKPTISFNLPEMVATGNGSCNNYRAEFTIDGSDIKFNAPAATKMFCPGTGEATFFKTLTSVNKYSVSENTLTLIMGDIAVMRLTKQ